MLDSGRSIAPRWEAARATSVACSDDLRDDEPHGQYFKEQVRRELVERFGWERVYEGGLRVFSTIDLRMQQAAETAVAEGLKALEAALKRWPPRFARPANASGRRGDATRAASSGADLHGSPAGHVRAMIGGRDFAESSFNRAVQAERQPGSAFKPFVYAAALEAGYSPSTMIENLNAPIDTLEGSWTPEDEHSTRRLHEPSRGPPDVEQSRGGTSARGCRHRPDRAVRQGSRVGNVPSVPSLALGSGEVTLQSLTAAYAAFANRGRVPKPILIRRVEDKDGRVLLSGRCSATRPSARPRRS